MRKWVLDKAWKPPFQEVRNIWPRIARPWTETPLAEQTLPRVAFQRHIAANARAGRLAGHSAAKAGVCLKDEFGHRGRRSVSKQANKAENRSNATDAGWLSTIDAAGAAAKMLAMTA